LACLSQDDSVYQGGFNAVTYHPLTPYLWMADTNSSIVYKITEAGVISGAFLSKSGPSFFMPACRPICVPHVWSVRML
jgi:hypothetical protein